MVRDAFARVAELDDETVHRLIDRLEFRGTDPFFVEMRETYLDRVGLAPEAEVLEIGCGTGVVLRALAKRSGFRGTVTGVDPGAAFIEAGRRLAAEEGLAAQIRLEVGDGAALPFGEATFDMVLIHTTISHVPDPLAVLREARRVVRPAGEVVIFDGDYESWTFAHPDHELARTIEAALIAAVVNNPRVLRDMRRLLRQVRLECIDTVANVYADVGTGTFFGPAIEAYGPLAVREGLARADAMERWLVDQREAMASGLFFAACNYYTYIARPS